MNNLNKMIEELVKKKLSEIAEEAATRIVEEQLKAVTGITKEKKEKKRNKGPNRYPMNAMLEVNPKARLMEKAGSKSLQIYQVAHELLKAGPAPRVDLCKSLMSELNLTLGYASRAITTFLDREYLKIVSE